MNKKNFDALIDHLEAIPKKAFGMDLWMTRAVFFIPLMPTSKSKM